MSVATMMATLKLNISDFASKLDTASTRLTKFATKTQSDYGKASMALKSHNLGLKDTARIVQGIVISQAFYAAVNAIRGATSALWNFNKELDYAQVTYSALFGSTDLANKFSTALQEHAVETIFDYQQLANVSKKLLAYGIEYKNLMYVMEGMTNLGAMSGDAQAMDRIALALGQIQTTGYLTATEMRQLANAYVPIYDIVQNTFGLSGKQMQSVGDLKLPAHEVINAIVDYANERFGAVGDAAMYTIKGVENRIVDTLKVVGSAMISPITTAYKSLLVYLSGGLEELRNAYDTGGLGGVFEFLVPDEHMQTTIRQFIANVKNLLMSLASVAKTVATLFGNFAHVAVTAFNIVTPVVTNFLNVLAATVNAMLQNSRVAAILRVALVAAAGAFVILRVQAVASLVITAVTKAVMMLSSALITLASIIVKHPIISLLFALGVALVGVSVSSDRANTAISGLFDTLSGAGGVSSKDVLQPIEKELSDGADAADEFNNRLEEGANAADDLSDAVGGAGKAAKKVKDAVGLLSFDEVFKLPEKSEASGGGGGSSLGGALGGINDLIGGLGGLSDALIPEIPDFSDFIKSFTDGLFGGLGESIIEKLKSIGIGSLIGGTLGAIIGGILGGPGGVKLGMALGTFAGGVVGWLWKEFQGAMSNGLTGLGAGIVGAISNALAKAGAASLGTVLKNAFANGGIKGVIAALAGTLKTAGLKSIVKGGLIGAAVGLIVDGIAHLLWTWMAESIESANADSAKVGQVIGSVLGTVIGAAFFGPAGAMVGSAIGTFAGGLVGLFWDPIKEYFNPETNSLSAFFARVGKDIGAWYVETWNLLSKWYIDSALGFVNWSSKTWSKLSTWFKDTTAGFSEWWESTFGGFATWLTDTIAIFTDYDNITGETLRNWWTSTKESFSSWVSSTFEDLSAWFMDTAIGFSEWALSSLGTFAKWYTDTSATFATWVQSIYNVFAGWADVILEVVLGWADSVIKRVQEWKTNVEAKFKDFKATAVAVIDGFKIAAVRAFNQWFAETFPLLSSSLNSIKTTWSKKWAEIKTEFAAWWSGLRSSIASWLEQYIWKPINDFFKLENFWNRLIQPLDKIKKKINSWWSGLLDKNINVTASVSGGASGSSPGHATGGVFNREHVARFAEGNKAEAIIPLENNRAMQPFVDAVSDGLISSLAPIVATVNAGKSNNLPPLYVGTLIADDRGIKQLYDKFEVIRLQESDRRGTTLA